MDGSDTNMKTILITAIGGDISQGAATVIRESFPDWRIVGSDMKERHGGELFVDSLLRSPSASDDGYESWLVSVLKAENADFCLPLSEAELGFFLERRTSKLAGSTIITPGFESLELGADKLETARFLTDIGVPAPWTFPSDHALSEANLPCIYKPRSGAGSKSVFVCNDTDQAAFYSTHFPGGVFQELLLPADKEVTCAVYRTKSGKTAVLQLLRELTGGFTGWAQVIDNQEITRQCEHLAEAVGLGGSINVQLRLTNDGPRIFEINSRFSSTTLMRHRMGFQDLVWTLQEEMGIAVELTKPPVGLTAVRVQGAAIIDVHQKGSGE